jgi:thioredoxin reductase (NADPH)
MTRISGMLCSNMAAKFDCIVVGGGPAGLTAATYLARFKRQFLVIDSEESRAALIPISRNFPGFPEGVAGAELLDRMRSQARKYGAVIVRGKVISIATDGNGFIAKTEGESLHARTVLLATGVVDAEPPLPAFKAAIKRGLLRHCCICDGFEAQDLRIGVLGHGEGGLNEALFLRTYSAKITLLSLGEKLGLDGQQQTRAQSAGIATVDEAIERVDMEENRTIALETRSGRTHIFDTLYSALGNTPRTDVVGGLGVSLNKDNCIEVDPHMQTNIPGLYAAGDVIEGLDQISTAVGNAAIAATAIHNRLRES